jgi:hypothetical protein
MRFFDWTWWRFGWGGCGTSVDSHYDEHGAWVCLSGSLWWLKEPIAYTWLEREWAPGPIRIRAFDPNDPVPKASFAHCDDLVLHRKGSCEFCDMYPERQQGRIDAGVNFTGETDPGKLPCPSTEKRSLETINRWPGNRPKAAM